MSMLQEKLSAVKRQLASFDDFVAGGEVTKHRETLVLLLRGAARLLAEMNAELLNKGDDEEGGSGSSPSVVFVRGGSTVSGDNDDDNDAIVIEDPMNASSVRGDDDDDESDE